MKNDRDRSRNVKRRRANPLLALLATPPVNAREHGVVVICGRCETFIEVCNCTYCHDAYYERGRIFPVIVSALPCMICKQEIGMNATIDGIFNGPTAEEP